MPNMDAPAERRERYSHTLDGAGYMGGGGRPPTRLISNWRSKTSRIRLHKEWQMRLVDCLKPL